MEEAIAVVMWNFIGKNFRNTPKARPSIKNCTTDLWMKVWRNIVGKITLLDSTHSSHKAEIP